MFCIDKPTLCTDFSFLYFVMSRNQWRPNFDVFLAYHYNIASAENQEESSEYEAAKEAASKRSRSGSEAEISQVGTPCSDSPPASPRDDNAGRSAYAEEKHIQYVKMTPDELLQYVVFYHRAPMCGLRHLLSHIPTPPIQSNSGIAVDVKC